MAKIKVHELAKELEIKSKDVITFLQEKGVDVKAAQSSIEGDAVEWVKKKFAAANKEPSDQKDSSRIGQAAQTERKAQVEKAETAEKTTQTAAVQAEGREEQTTDKQDMNKEVAGQDSQAKAHKKAKTIIVVNNPQNSRMKNGNSGNNDRRNNNGNGAKNDGRRNDGNRGSQNRQGNRNNNGMRMESRPLIKPLTKPSQPVMPDEKLLSRERAAKEAAAKAAAEAERAAKAAEIEAQKKKRLRQRNVWRRAWSALREPSSATTALKEQIAPKERTVPITEMPETETETDPVTTVITETETDPATTVTTEMETDLATTVTTETETDPVTTVITETVTETSPAAEMVRVRKGHPVMEQEETRTVRVITAVQEIIRAIIALQAVAALVRAITVLVQMADALRTAMDGRTIDSASRQQAKALQQKLRQRIRKSAETIAVLTSRSATRNREETRFTKKTAQQH